MANFGPKPWVIPLAKNSIFRLFNLFFYNLERHFFPLEYRKTLFPGLYFLKTKDGKMANFGLKPWVNPLQKSQFFHLLRLLFLWPRKALFRSRIS